MARHLGSRAKCRNILATIWMLVLLVQAGILYLSWLAKGSVASSASHSLTWTMTDRPGQSYDQLWSPQTRPGISKSLSSNIEST